MKCAVIVMATLMIIASMLLVGVSLAMAEHIDELGMGRSCFYTAEGDANISHATLFETFVFTE